MMLSKRAAREMVDGAVAGEALLVESELRALHETLGVCHKHPHVRISTGGGTPMYDGLCGECEAEMDAEFDPFED